METATITVGLKVTVLHSPETKRQNTITNLLSYNLYWKTVQGCADDASLVKEPESSLPFSRKFSIGPSWIQPLSAHTQAYRRQQAHIILKMHCSLPPFPEHLISVYIWPTRHEPEINSLGNL